MNNLFQEYAELMHLISELETKKDALQLQLIDEMDSDGTKEKKTKFGTFFISGRRTYQYSPLVQDLQKKVYIQKKSEERDGTAELMRDTQFIRFMRPGEKKNE